MSESKNNAIEFGICKGRMMKGVLQLLKDAHIRVNVSERGYRPTISLPNYNVKLLKPQNILEMLHNGTRDLGFAGADWVRNLGVDVVELLDTGLDPVRIVAAGPDAKILEMAKDGRHLRVASEYETITKEWIKEKGLNATFIRAFGATESFPPEDADIILDNTATGSTLAANGLHILDVAMTSSTRLFASKQALANPDKKKQIDELVLILKAVLSGREHQMVEFNVVGEELYKTVIAEVPSMRAPTVSKLELIDGEQGFAIRTAVKQKELPSLLPRLKSLGVTEIVVSDVNQIIL